MTETTLIESLIRRAGGSVITLGDEEYHFKPNENGAHVCSVADVDHAERLLSIREGYALYVPGAKPGKPAKAAAATPKDDGFDVRDEVVDSILDDGEAGDELEAEAMRDPDAASNRAIQRWADNRGINHRNKQAVADYADQTFGIELDRAKSALLMTRELIKLENSAIASD